MHRAIRVTPARSGAAILAWLVQGCLAWQREGLSVPKAVKDTTQEYRNEMDPLRDFLADRCIVNSTAKAKKAELWEAYEKWAKAAGTRALGNRQLGARLLRQGFDEGSDGKARFWIGLGLRTDTTDTIDPNSHNFELNSPHESKLRKTTSVVSVVSVNAEPPEREPGEEG